MPQLADQTTLERNHELYNDHMVRAGTHFELFAELRRIMQPLKHARFGNPFVMSRHDGRQAVADLLPDTRVEELPENIWPIGKIGQSNSRYRVFILNGDGNVLMCSVIAGRSTNFLLLQPERLEGLERKVASVLTENLRTLQRRVR